MPRETRVMLDGIMQAQFRQIEAAGPIRAIQKIRGEFGHEEAKGRGEVESLPDSGVEFFEGYVLPIVREDAMICQCV